ncbi:hypothetical protein A6V39_00985 [Candidatus Mycoplasma haematobovis]|uniref:Uncharacterized protein n=1 Tax=Candidatus Mycoplasma haematobovis TaxID=432608 RepID=A0A1A9QDS6_9MOLU|nr:hypothetical protein [Candidatus Mycoplasma haematobovis]OAL10627.1 hypothetical protein A6V39_00985 [Candidatus Mycoplasma haematobovis]
MFKLLIKYIGISGMCGCAVLASTSFTNEDERESPHRVSLSKREGRITAVNKLEDIDVWGKQNGCSFVFIEDWNRKQIYNAEGFAGKKGGKDKEAFKTTKDNSKQNTSTTWEEAIVKAVNDFKDYCKIKLNTFSFQWSAKHNKFYIADPNITPRAEVEQVASRR